MLAITDDAKELLRDVLEQRGQPGQALRLSETAEDLEVTLDQAAEDDAIYRCRWSRRAHRAAGPCG